MAGQSVGCTSHSMHWAVLFPLSAVSLADNLLPKLVRDGTTWP